MGEAPLFPGQFLEGKVLPAPHGRDSIAGEEQQSFVLCSGDSSVPAIISAAQGHGSSQFVLLWTRSCALLSPQGSGRAAFFQVLGGTAAIRACSCVEHLGNSALL